MAVKTKGAPQGGPGAAAAAKAKAARERAKRAAAKRRAQQKKKDKCKKKVSKAQKDKLRGSTPSTAATNKVNSGKKPAKCPTCGRTSPFGAAPPSTKSYNGLAADHIVPFNDIIKKKGFACLKEADQKKVLNNPKNFTGICQPCNASRKVTPWNKWNGHKKFGITKPGEKFAKQMAAKSPGISKALDNQITNLL